MQRFPLRDGSAEHQLRFACHINICCSGGLSSFSCVFAEMSSTVSLNSTSIIVALVYMVQIEICLCHGIVHIDCRGRRPTNNSVVNTQSTDGPSNRALITRATQATKYFRCGVSPLLEPEQSDFGLVALLGVSWRRDCGYAQQCEQNNNNNARSPNTLAQHTT